MPPPLPLVALFVPMLLGIVPPKALAESQGVILYFSTERYVSLESTLVPLSRHNVSDKYFHTVLHIRPVLVMCMQILDLQS